MRTKIVLINAIVILVTLNILIFNKETVLRDGKEVFLELAPADPRSLMQGDYMTLRYRLSDEVMPLSPSTDSEDGYIIVSIGADHVARSPRLAKGSEMPGANELKLFYRKRDRSIKIATDAFFFEEGQARAYNRARYGILRVDDSGHSVLSGVADESFQRLVGSK